MKRTMPWSDDESGSWSDESSSPDTDASDDDQVPQTIKKISTGGSSKSKGCHYSSSRDKYSCNLVVHDTKMHIICTLLLDAHNDADKYFKEMSERDEITWNTLIAGYEEYDPMKSLQLFLHIESRGCTPNCFTYSSIIAACTNLSVLTCGQHIHGGIFKRGHQQNLPLANSLIDMYAKSRSIQDSKRIFYEISDRDLVSWTSMMIGFGSHGYRNEAVELFSEMVNLGIRPDTIVFMAVLSACSHAGLVEKGLKYFKLMKSKYKISPSQEIYACVIDLLGRGGRVKEAYDMIQSMPFKPDESVWATFLGACRAQGLPIMGNMTAQQVLDSKPKRTGIYVTMANMYAAEGKWDDRAKMRNLINESGNKKVVCRIWVELHDQVYSFVAGDGGVSHIEPMYQVLRVLGRQMVERIDFPVGT